MSRKHATVFTIGHSTHPLKEFISFFSIMGLGISSISEPFRALSYNPQFNEAHLCKALKKHQIKYTHMSGLGGLRHAKADSINRGWHHASFRGYADYMQTEEFIKNVEELAAMAKEEQVGIMCAESLPWRCHRSLVSDALLIRGLEVRGYLF